MKTTPFHWNSIRWLRQEQRLETEVVPASPIEDVRAPLHVPGFFARSMLPRRFAFVGLWVLALGLVLAMTGTPALSIETRESLREIGRAWLLLGAVLELMAFVASRMFRERVLVELRPAAAGPATAASLEALRGSARGAEVWVVCEQMPEPMALTVAGSLGIRWFVPQGDGETWREHATRRSSPIVEARPMRLLEVKSTST
jgi:hypothetical protein